jgi:hypothetical protein
VVIESHTKKYGSVQKGLFSKAAATWAGGAYERVREPGQVAICLRDAAPAKAENADGGLIQHFLNENPMGGRWAKGSISCGKLVLDVF